MNEEHKESKDHSSIITMLKEAFILFIITILAGLALGFVYQLTKEPIEKQEIQKLQNACKAVFQYADTFEMTHQDQDIIDSFMEEQSSDSGVKIGTVYKALDTKQEVLGYVLTLISTKGYGGNIEMMMGIRMDGTLNGISLLKISETPGLGMRAEEVLVPQFENKEVSVFQYTKTGATLDSQIDAISGATITTKAVTNTVNTGLAYFEQILKKGGN